MRNTVQTFATSLLDHVRTSYELEILLNHNPKGDPWEPGERLTLERLKLAIKYKQKAVMTFRQFYFIYQKIKYYDQYILCIQMEILLLL